MSKEYYKGINRTHVKALKSDNPLAYKYYDPDKVVAGKKMKKTILNLLLPYWQTF